MSAFYLGYTYLGTYIGGITYFSHADLQGAERARTLMTTARTITDPSFAKESAVDADRAFAAVRLVPLSCKNHSINRSTSMRMMYFCRLLIPLAVACCLVGVGRCEEVEKVTACQLKSNSSAYNHKLVEVTAFVSHGFEDFSLFDPACLPWMGIWLEYGGSAMSGTMFCCGVTASRSRPKPLNVEQIPIPLTEDDRFHQFDKLIQQRPDVVVHATLVGRFFAGKPQRMPNGTMWGAGYGHMGCCSLLAIQQVLSVEPHDRDDLDYRAFPEQPDIRKVGCGYRHLMSFEPFIGVIDAQQKAETEQQSWVFDDPGRVASEGLARLIRIDESAITELKQTSAAQGHAVYKWKNYMVVVSRPYLATFYARDPKRIAWVVIAAYESGCGKDGEIKRIK